MFCICMDKKKPTGSKKPKIARQRSDFSRVFGCYWQSAKNYRLFLGVIFAVYGIATLVSNVATPLVYRWIVDIVSQGGVRQTAAGPLMEAFVWLAGLILVYSVLYRIGDYTISYVQSHVLKALTDRSLKELERHSYKFFSDNFVGSLVTKSKRFVNAFEAIFDTLAYSIWMGFVGVTGVLVSLFLLAPLLGTIFLVWLVMYLWLIWFLMKKKLILDEIEASQDSHVIARFADVLSNMLAVKMFASGKNERTIFDSMTESQCQARLKAWNFQNIVFAFQGFIFSFLEIAAMYVAIRLWLSGAISSGTVVVVQIYIGGIFGFLWSFGRSFSGMVKRVAEATEMVEIFDLPEDVIDPQEPRTLEVKRGEIRMENVTFRYAEGDDVFKNFSLRVASGEKIGLVGPSGAGKSTITKLLLRFVDPQSGTVSIDGQDIKGVCQDDVRTVIAYVPQEPLLFHRSLRENIAYGKPAASDEEIIAAAKKAYAHDFISVLPQGYETLVGERGVKLSGGERQRVAIARAILKDAPILMLDEATSSLDSESEHAIQMALDELMKGKTAIVIAHRLSTVKKLDRIVVMGQEGQIVEEGQHEQLLEQNGLYAQLWSRQTGGFIDEEEHSETVATGEEEI